MKAVRKILWHTPLRFYILVFLFNLLPIYCVPVPVSLSELESANNTCAPRDSCVTSERRNRFGFPNDWKLRNCFCDNLCAEYGDCCTDANAYNAKEQSEAILNYQCVNLRHFDGIYMKTQCDSNWEDDEIKNKCALGSSDEDITMSNPMLYMPVTNKLSRQTYRNYYCAVCNNDSNNLNSWIPRLECPSLTTLNRESPLNRTFIKENLIYKDGYWGVSIGEDNRFHNCHVDPFLPTTAEEIVRPCLKTVQDCADDWEDEEMRRKCSSYTAVVYENDKPYKNLHCAKCNKANTENFYCEKHILSRFNFRNEFNPNAFSLLFDFSDNSGNNAVGISSKCGLGELWDPFFTKCRKIICSKEGQSYRNGKCIDILTETSSTTATPVTENDIFMDNKNSTNENNMNESTPNSIEINFPGENSQENIDQNRSDTSNVTLEPDLETTTINQDVLTSSLPNNELSGKKPYSLNCNRILLPDEEFEKGPNGTIVVKGYSRTYLPHEYEIHEGGVLVCTVLSELEKFSNVMGYVSFIGLGISCACIIIHLVAFVLVPELRNLSGKNLCSLCLCLLFAYICFILGVFGEAGKLECFIMAVLMYYFFLASFCWMNVMAFDIWFTLRLATSELRVAGGRQIKKFIYYSIYGWFTPMIAVAVAVTLDTVKPDSVSSIYYPEFGERLCWFGQRKSLLLFFATPLTVIMTANILLFVMAARIIAATTSSTAKLSCSAPHQNQFKLYMRLALLMGLTWISGIVAGYLQMEVIWYIFVILNTLQGFFIFASFTCNKKVCRTFGGSCWRKIKVARHTSTAWGAKSYSSNSRQGLDSQDSNQSHLSQSSVAHLTTNTSRSNIDSF